MNSHFRNEEEETTKKILSPEKEKEKTYYIFLKEKHF
jgi:hypothetical protein